MSKSVKFRLGQFPVLATVRLIAPHAITLILVKTLPVVPFAVLILSVLPLLAANFPLYLTSITREESHSNQHLAKYLTPEYCQEAGFGGAIYQAKMGLLSLSVCPVKTTLASCVF
jgi:hypothetical protein